MGVTPGWALMKGKAPDRTRDRMPERLLQFGGLRAAFCHDLQARRSLAR